MQSPSSSPRSSTPDSSQESEQNAITVVQDIPPPPLNARLASSHCSQSSVVSTTTNDSQSRPTSRQTPRAATRSAVKSSRPKNSPLRSATTSKESVSRSFGSPLTSNSFYYVKKPPVASAVPLGTSAGPEDIKMFLDLAEQRQKAFEINKYSSCAWQTFWFIAVLCIIYFGFVGFPIWDGICYSLW